MTYTFVEGAVSSGALDTYDLTAADRNRLFKVFGNDITCSDVSIKMNSAKVSNLGVSFIGAIIDEIKKEVNESQGIKETSDNKIEKQYTSGVTKSENSYNSTVKTKQINSKQEKQEQQARKVQQEQQTQIALQAKKEQQMAMQKAKAEREAKIKEQKRQRRLEYERKTAQQTKRNQQIAASSAVSSASALVLIGTAIYSNYGYANPSNMYNKNNMFLNFDLGYTSNILPIIFNSSVGEYNYNDDFVITEQNEQTYAFTVNITPSLDWGYETDRILENTLDGYMINSISFGAHAYASLDLGFSPVFNSFLFGANAGFRVYPGLKNIKFLMDFGWGKRNYSVNRWITEDTGQGIADYSTYNYRSGIRFSWYSESGISRHHVNIGVMNEKITKTRDDGDEFHVAQRIDSEGELSGGYYTPNNLNENQENPNYTGFFIEWEHDHHGKVFLEIFPDYPAVGDRPTSRDDEYINEGSSPFTLKIGFVRSIDSFFN